MGHKVKIGNEIKDIKGGKVLINGEVKDIKGGKVLIGSTNYDISFGTPLGELATKTSIYMNVDGVRTEWMVAHQGIPDATIYDASCNGTWLLMKDVYTTMGFSNSNNVYSVSKVHTYLNDTFLELLDADIKNAVKQVIIPVSNSDSVGTLFTGADGLPTKVFVLSAYECGSTSTSYINKEGAVLDCFTSNADRIAYLNGTASGWTTRSPYKRGLNYYWNVSSSGTFSQISVSSTSNGVRPALIFDPKETLVDSDFNIMIA